MKQALSDHPQAWLCQLLKEEWDQYKTSTKHYLKSDLCSLLEEVWTTSGVPKAANGTLHLFQPSGKPLSAPHTVKTKTTHCSPESRTIHRGTLLWICLGGPVLGSKPQNTEEARWGWQKKQPSCEDRGNDLAVPFQKTVFTKAGRFNMLSLELHALQV